jgi:hypothetical protein
LRRCRDPLKDEAVQVNVLSDKLGQIHTPHQRGHYRRHEKVEQVRRSLFDHSAAQGSTVGYTPQPRGRLQPSRDNRWAEQHMHDGPRTRSKPAADGNRGGGTTRRDSDTQIEYGEKISLRLRAPYVFRHWRASLPLERPRFNGEPAGPLAGP